MSPLDGERRVKLDGIPRRLAPIIIHDLAFDGQFIRRNLEAQPSALGPDDVVILAQTFSKPWRYPSLVKLAKPVLADRALPVRLELLPLKIRSRCLVHVEQKLMLLVGYEVRD